jgi:hypothetical protein
MLSSHLDFDVRSFNLHLHFIHDSKTIQTVIEQEHKSILLFGIYMSTYLLTELSPSWEAANFAAIQELLSILWNLKVHYRVHKSPPLFPSQYHPILSL